ncbi:hypothetical protein [Mucilaginibacter sp.]|uniref:hypothetical protein n=1 Tax=Mucilaginibacter sp. TaxID=1882438 RepID=UPI00284DC838|nr:hypothetical protein [Mucilaginibacter sp.]MDR3696151.1 hypothetical protein [Mucilaginibacter sp.]
MKKPLGYPELWQKKQRELPVKGNADAEWQRISAILDKRMPTSGVVNKPSRFKMPKWGLKLLVGVSSVVAVYVAGRLYLSKKHHDSAKPNIQQIHRDSVAPAANGTSPAQGIAKPVTVGSTQGISPITGSADRRFTGQAKLNNDVPMRGRHVTDSIKAPDILNVPIHRDSMLAPMEAAPLKPVRDSVGPVELRKNDIQKDTSNNNKKTPKKKRRSKVSIFF